MLNNISEITQNFLKQKSEIDNYKKKIEVLKSQNDELLKENKALKIENEKNLQYKSYYCKYIRSIQEKNKLEAKIKKLEDADKPKIDTNVTKDATNEIFYDSTEYLLFQKNNSQMFSILTLLTLFSGKYTHFQ